MSTMARVMKKEGSILGGVLLIAGSCIGAGMLALPILTGIGGFFPSVILFFVSWAFMSLTALLLLEANLTLGYKLSLVSIAEKTLGRGGKILCWALFVFLFYSLNVAYISASGSILSTVFADLFGLSLPSWSGSILFTLLFGAIICFGTRAVDHLNRGLMVGLIFLYGVLVYLGSQHVNVEFLKQYQWIPALTALPVMIISFGFHNMIPTLAHYFKGDVKRLRLTVILGGLIPLLVYLVWEVVMLGILPLQGREGLLKALNQGEEATQALRMVVGRSWVSTMGHAFALFAIITSFLAQSLSLVDFLADGLKLKNRKQVRGALVGLALAPPFILALLYPGLFLRALNLAGGFSAVILFGLMPALMIWKLRQQKKYPLVPVLPNRRAILVFVIIFSIGVFLLEAAQELGLSLIPAEFEVVP